MVTSQKSTITLPELLFEHFTELYTTEDTTTLQVYNKLINEYSKKEIRRIIEDPSLRSIRCSSNEHAIDLLLLRALGLVEKKKEPVVLVVKSAQKAKEVLALLDEQLATAKIANLFTQIKRKRNYTIYGDLDFIICSYQKLYHLLTKTNSDKKNQTKTERLNVSGVVFLAPLSRTKYRSECILLDQILNVLPKRTAYTFIHGEELCFRKEDSEWLFNGPAIVYKREEFYRRDLLKDFRLNIFEDRNLVAAARRENDFSGICGASYLLKLILSATFHRRKNLKELKSIVKKSISYKLWFAFEEALLKDPDEIITYSINYQLWLILDYLTTKCNLKLLFLKENSCYYLTSEGRQFFHRFCFSDGLSVSLFYILNSLSKKIEKGYLSANDLEDLLIDFTDLSIIWDVFYLDDDNSTNQEVRNALNNSYAFRSAHDIFEGLDENFGLLAEDAKRTLAAQKNILRKESDFSIINREVESQIQLNEVEEITIEGNEDPKITKIYSKEFLEEFILKIVYQENISPQKITELATRTGVGKHHIKNTLIKLERNGECQKISTKGVHSEEVIFGTEENLLAEPHLSETCDTCVSLNKKIRLCIINRLLMEVAYSSLTQEELLRAINHIQKTIRACGGYKKAEESRDFTLSRTEFGTYTRKNSTVLSVNSKDSQTQNKHLCVFCTHEIAALGSLEEPFFPSKTITCSNCNSKYIYNEEKDKVRCISDDQNVIRSIIINKLAYVPEILKQKEERIPLTISDTDDLELIKNSKSISCTQEDGFKDYYLIFNNRKYVFAEIERVYFQGNKHLEIEEALKQLGFTRMYRKQTKKQDSKEELEEEKNFKIITLDEVTIKRYQQIIELLRNKGVMINSSLQSKINSVITFILAFSKSQKQGKKSKKANFNKELGECIKILIRAKDNVNDPEAARTLEGQAFNQAFKILKTVGQKAGIRSWGRVVSRLVTWLVFATFTRTCAYSKMDAMLNHLFKIVLNELKEVHQKTGIAVDFGPGLLHYRKSRSDIDRIGLFLDLVDFVRLLVIFVLAEAISNKKITSKDCRLFLGRESIPLYDIEIPSLKKFEMLAEHVLSFKISFKGQNVSLKEAYEDYLNSFRLFLNHLSKFNVNHLAQLSQNELTDIVNECLVKANCQTISFSVKDFEQKIEAINFCSKEWKFLYEGYEDKFLARKKAREDFRREAMTDLFSYEAKTIDLICNSSQEKYKVSLTKYQKRECRWMMYLILIFSIEYQKRYPFDGYTLKRIQNLLGLKYTRTRLLLKKALDKKLLLRAKIRNAFYYKLNTGITINKLILKLLNSNLSMPSQIFNDNIMKIQTLKTRIKEYSQDYFEKSPVLLINNKIESLEQILKFVLIKIKGDPFNYDKSSK